MNKSEIIKKLEELRSKYDNEINEAARLDHPFSLNYAHGKHFAITQAIGIIGDLA